MADPVEDEIRAHLGDGGGLKVIEGGKKPRRKIRAKPYVFREAALIPPREWVYGRHYIRKFASGTVAPGSVGKSILALVEAIAMATGRELLGVKVKAPLRVWYWNGEDPYEEIERRVAAICLHFRISEADLGGRLFLNSGREKDDPTDDEGCEIIIGTEETREGMTIATPVVEDLKATLLENEIDVWILDPFVSVHEVNENDNNKIGTVVKTFAQIADATNTACELIHHTKKSSGQDGENTALDARGAGAFVDRCRSVRALLRMTKEEGEQFGLDTAAKEHRRHFRVEQGKANLSAPHAHTIWRKLVDVPMGNQTEDRPEDHVGVVVVWEATDAMKGFTPQDTLAVQQQIKAGNHRWDAKSPEWVGLLILDRMDWSKDDANCKSMVRKLLAEWVKNGLIEVVEGKDDNRKTRQFVRVKTWIEIP